MSHSPPTRLANALRLWLTMTGYQQQQLAEACGVSCATISRYLDGKSALGSDALVRLHSWLQQPDTEIRYGGQ